MNTADTIRVISQNKGRITCTELAAQTGADQFDALETLKKLVSQYNCVLKATDAGEVLYDFGTDFKPRVSIGQNLAELMLVIRRHATDILLRILQIWVLVALFIYTIVFTVATFGGFTAADIIAKLFTDMAVGIKDAVLGRQSTHRLLTRAMTKPGQRLWEVDWLNPDQDKIPLHEKVWTAFFGTLRLPMTRTEQQETFMAYVNQVNGVVVPVEWAEFFECDLDNADQAITSLYAKYGADIRVTDNGTLIYDFSAVLGKGFSADVPAPAYLYSALQHELAKNKTVLMAQGLNLLNLIAGVSFLIADKLAWINPSNIKVGLVGVIPIVSSSLLLLFSITRTHNIFSRARTFRRAVFHHILQNDMRISSDIDNAVAQLDRECPFPVKRVSNTVFVQTLAMLKADMIQNGPDQNPQSFGFPIVSTQLSDIKTEKPMHKIEDQKIVYSSKEKEQNNARNIDRGQRHNRHSKRHRRDHGH